MYVDERLTTEAIAARLGCGASTVARRLRRLGIPVRPRGPQAAVWSMNVPPAWSPELAWVVGLIATDGNLANNGRTVSVTSADVDLLDTVRQCLGLGNPGCIDGDGTVLVYTDRSHAAEHPSYVYCRLYVSLVSASPRFVSWLEATVDRLFGLRGRIHLKRTSAGRPCWVLRYARRASVRLLHRLYHGPDVPCLRRKRAKAEAFLRAHS
jgi:hypothetical protein